MRCFGAGVLMTLVLAVALAGCHGAAKPVGDEMSLGSPSAKVTVVEYASVACPVCAAFNNEVFPDFKKKYVDTGKVRYVAREIISGNPSLAASGFLLARCVGPDKYFQVTDAIYHAQSQIYEPDTENVRAGVGRDILVKIAQQAGLSEDQFSKCVSDEAALKALNDRVDKFSRQDNVANTPTFIINGTRLEGYQTLGQLDQVVQPLLK
jgi:protein-disulfide isomerase